MKIPAYKILVKFSEELKDASYERHLISEQYKLNQLRRTKSNVSSVSVSDLNFVQLSTGWMHDLSKPCILFIHLHVMPAIRMYNLLWHWPTPKKRNEKMVLKELIDKKILFRTESIGIYIVNPIKIWRGTIFSAVECTKKLLLDSGKPDTSLIHDLKPGSEYTLQSQEDQYDLLNDNGITPNLLDI